MVWLQFFFEIYINQYPIVYYNVLQWYSDVFIKKIELNFKTRFIPVPKYIILYDYILYIIIFCTWFIYFNDTTRID